jgi:LDH2 family malate/lactate/ureidoglycolate dehydrogenase
VSPPTADPVTDRRFDHDELRSWTAGVLQRLGVRPVHAQSAARVLVASDLQGIDSHGVARLPAYADQLRRGAMATDGDPELIRDDGSTALVDAHNILGHPASEFAMGEAITRARTHGVGWVAVRNSNHYGIAGYYARQAAELGLIGLTGTNAGARVAPAGARQPFLGTNPFAFAAPSAEPPLFVLDMATSAVSTGKFEIAVREGREIPEGWGVDRHGGHTRDPRELERGGWLLPLGSFPGLSSHKGYGLGLVVEILSALLAGGPYGPGVQNLLFASSANPPRVSHFFCALDPARFGERDGFARTVTAMLDDLRALPAEDDQRPVMTPGEPEWRHEQERRATGIPLIAPVVTALTELGERTDLGLQTPSG